MSPQTEEPTPKVPTDQVSGPDQAQVTTAAPPPHPDPGRDEPAASSPTEPDPDATRCFLDITIGPVRTGRIVCQLFHDIVPQTTRNFQSLCSGEAGLSGKSGRPLHYRGSIFHRVIKGFMLQGGDFVSHNGSGGESIYGKPFPDENLDIKHDRPFLLSMANRGPNTNGSQFFITTEPAPHLDGLHVVFGHVVSGQEVVREIEDLQTDKLDRPLQDVKIANCGILVLKNQKRRKKSQSRPPSHKAERKKNKKKNKKMRSASTGSSSSSSSSSPSSPSSSSSSEDSTVHEKRQKRKKKSKKKKKKRTKGQEEEGEEVSSENEATGEAHPLAQITDIDPDEIPVVPENRFLFRGEKKRDELAESSDKPRQRRTDKRDRRSRSRSNSRDRSRGRFRPTRPQSNSAKKIKGRGRMHFRPRDWSRSRSRTPPHWRNETQKTISLAEFEKKKREEKKRKEEMDRRAEERQKRHEEREKAIQKRILERELTRRKESEKMKRNTSAESSSSPKEAVKSTDVKVNASLVDVRDFDKLDYEANESDPEEKRRRPRETTITKQTEASEDIQDRQYTHTGEKNTLKAQ
ncbi:hypothetical protein TCAL_11543 [Tigriopus californicus]|uniref:peptidylprolyl isomerase n=1 Tax=Tigriopus californicus TaxID=6832 RepID=A0A553NYS6_TIGCA|nr:hypothetical protein TCAL_11543 [Tigriopus californicus]|eukprot:TCALIF_11543-PA protein Name:"Similar to cpr6 Peptidyl-prolyl cis-trans isomerase D (Emericella nidulans (strain FGSC A4 / ATCC 38163 / CBS 112.46 / NRRL 194 / M139))" AED:0.05 eAED:0.05 QI:0/0/0/0.5/1/1/2/0/574